MKEKQKASQKGNIKAVAAGTTVLLMIPLIAMQFTSEVNWDLYDFIIMGVLLFSTGFALSQINQNVDKHKRLFYMLFVLGIFMLVWAELAVGVFGSPFAGS